MGVGYMAAVADMIWQFLEQDYDTWSLKHKSSSETRKGLLSLQPQTKLIPLFPCCRQAHQG